MEFIWQVLDFIFSYSGLVTIVAAGLATLIGIVSKQNKTGNLLRETAFFVFEYIEANYKEWGISGQEKWFKFLQMVRDQYYDKTGEELSNAQVGELKGIVEQAVEVQKSGN